MIAQNKRIRELERQLRVERQLQAYDKERHTRGCILKAMHPGAVLPCTTQWALISKTNLRRVFSFWANISDPHPTVSAWPSVHW